MFLVFLSLIFAVSCSSRLRRFSKPALVGSHEFRNSVVPGAETDKASPYRVTIIWRIGLDQFRGDRAGRALLTQALMEQGDRRPAVIIAYLFPPAEGIPVLRILTLAQFLAENTFEVYVLFAED